MKEELRRVVAAYREETRSKGNRRTGLLVVLGQEGGGWAGCGARVRLQGGLGLELVHAGRGEESARAVVAMGEEEIQVCAAVDIGIGGDQQKD